MTFMQLVLRNVTRNGRTYASYFFSSLFSVLVFFVFSLLFFHPSLQSGVVGSSQSVSVLATAGVRIAQAVIVIMSFVFLWYTFGLFIKARTGDLSVYLIMGMSERDLRRMIFWENILMGLTSIVTGIAAGFLFSKVVLLSSQNILGLEGNLPFYLPIKPILLTLSVFLLIFFIISLVTTMAFKTGNLTEMAKGNARPAVEPKTRWYLTLAAGLLLVLGYGGVLYFSILYSRKGDFFMPLLVIGVLLTIAGTYLFFQQNSIGLFLFLKKQPLFFKKTNMLSISKLVFRMKHNATMYFMIAIVASVALVGIGTTMTITSEQFASNQGTGFAYIYNGAVLNQPEGKKYHEKNIELIEKAIANEGYSPSTVEVLSLPVSYKSPKGQQEWVSLIKASDYQKLQGVTGQKVTSLPVNRAAIIFAASNTMIRTIKQDKSTQDLFEGQLFFGDEEEGVPFAYSYSEERFSLDSDSTAIVADDYFGELAARSDQLTEGGKVADTPVFVVHYPEWRQGQAVDQRIRQDLDKETSSYDQMIEAVYDSFESYDDQRDLTEAEEAALDAVSSRYFFYESLYQTWLEARQTNGTILLISVLLGAVFFTFAACIIYFRLFGELEQEGQYHCSLHILGVSQKDRHKVSTTEMLLMYFVPVIVAFIHFAVAMTALGILSGFSEIAVFVKLVCAYTIFQLLFFGISRWRYLKHLDLRAETI